MAEGYAAGSGRSRRWWVGLGVLAVANAAVWGSAVLLFRPVDRTADRPWSSPALPVAAPANVEEPHPPRRPRFRPSPKEGGCRSG